MISVLGVAFGFVVAIIGKYRNRGEHPAPY